MSSGMIILVGMSSMKFLQKKQGQARRNGLTESFLSASFCQGDLMYPIYILVPNVLSSANVLTLSHHCDCSGTQWNSGEIK